MYMRVSSSFLVLFMLVCSALVFSYAFDIDDDQQA